MANSVRFTNNTIISTYDTAGAYVWSKDTETTSVTVIAWGGGGGGGSGHREAGAACGGGGGGAGSVFMYVLPALFFGATETVVVGAGGAGGAGQAVDSSNGNHGSDGAESIVGLITTANTWIDAQPVPTTHHQKGRGGSVAIVDFETGEAGLIFVGGPTLFQLPAPNISDLVYHAYYGPSNTGAGNNGKTPFTTGGSSGIVMAATSGGEGGGANAGAEKSGGNGGALVNQNAGITVLAGGIGGLESLVINGGAGLIQVSTGGFCTGGSGGGGGGGQFAGAAAGIGGVGGFPGGGGGGGGGSLNGTLSGAGGKGGDGLVIIIEHS